MKDRAELLRAAIHRLFTRREQRENVTPDGLVRAWTFDFRPLLLQGETLNAACEFMWESIRGMGAVQIGGLETVAITLVAGVLMKARERGTVLNGFYIRKSRRKDGFQQQVEGALTSDPIVLLDDGINSGHTIMRQLKVLESLGHRVIAVCVLVRFREESFYTFFAQRGIKIISLFTLDDFPETGGLRALEEQDPIIAPSSRFDTRWKFASPDPVYHHVIPKSAPAIDDSQLYVGSDNGTMWALKQTNGSVAWSFKTLFGAGKKRIFSSPAVHNGVVYFGAYDGNVYALDAATGARRWTFMEADWIGSSPALAPDLGVLFIGLEFGLWRKQGGIAALDLKTGEKKWWHNTASYTHSSPAYSKAHGVVVVGSEDGVVYAYGAKKGALLWTFKAGDSVKASFALHEKRGLVCFGSYDTYIYVLNVKTGELVYKIQTLEPIYSSPTVHGDTLYFGVLDKQVYAIDLNTGKVLWTHWTQSRIFADPVIVEHKLYIGSNDGRLYEFDATTGKETGSFQTTERIVNRIAYNPQTRVMFVPTYANEVYAVMKKDGEIS